METSIPSRVAIVGAGISALLLARRLRLRSPTMHIDLYEQEEQVGGRLTCRDATLRIISPTLADFWDQTLRSDPEAADLQQLTNVKTLETIGLVTQGKMFEIAHADLFSQTTIKILSNRQTSQHWERFTAASSSKKCKTLDRLYVTTLNKLAPLLGLPDLCDLTIAVCQKKIANFSTQEWLYTEDWQPALSALTQSVNVHNDCPVVAASCEQVAGTSDSKQAWHLVSKAGAVDYDMIVAAHPLWSADGWLAKKYLDPFALHKEAPISSLCIGVAAGRASLPTCMFVASEQVLVLGAGDLYVLSIRLPFEVSLQAPRVLQALGKLKRAARSLQKHDQHLKPEPLWVALMPAALVIPVPTLTDVPLFCGDNYGDDSEDTDSNIVASVLNGVDNISSRN
ncbi:MAG: NAD(P)-binding protein [Pseudomonadota bacterium]|nr:NAD(P)-binding protein [Pseudomonadota bacterium]